MTSSDNLPLRAATFPDPESADRAVSQLVEAGFPAESVSVVCPQCEGDDVDARVELEEPAGARTPRAVLTGGTVGAVLGGLAVAGGIVASGGTGLLVAGSLLGGTASGALAGGFVGAMTTRGLEPEIADFYDQALARGSVLVAVERTEGAPDLDAAEAVFAACGAEAIPLRRG